MRIKLQKGLVALNVILVLMTFGAYCSPMIDPKQSMILPILGLGYPALLVANCFAILIWLWMDKKYAWISLITLVIGFGSCRKLINVSLPDKMLQESVSIGSYNSNFLKPIAFAKEVEQLELQNEFENYIKGLDLDILCVQESGWRSDLHIQNAMNYNHVHREKGLTLTIYSKYPFANTGKVDFSSNIANACIWVDIQLQGKIVRLYTTHLESNRHDGQVPEVIEQEAPEEMSNAALLGIVKHYQRFTSERVVQAEMIQQHRKASDYPVIICGDFNDTPQSRVYQVARSDMQDTFLEEGIGLGSTFGEKIPGLRIDYIFAEQNMEVLDHDISKSHFSDHYLVSAQLLF